MDASQIDHDGLFKALLREFFFEFLTQFFPKLAAATDPASLEFIATEIQVNLPDGRAHQADLVVKAKFMGSDILLSRPR